jgi:hypothetical protein
MTLVVKDSHSLYTITAWVNGNTEEDLLTAFRTGKTRSNARAVALFRSKIEAVAYIATYAAGLKE